MDIGIDTFIDFGIGTGIPMSLVARLITIPITVFISYGRRGASRMTFDNKSCLHLGGVFSHVDIDFDIAASVV